MSENFHPSLQINTKISSYISSATKYYYLPLFTTGLLNQGVAHQLGFYNHLPRNLEQVQSSLVKAKVARYSHMKLPVDRWVPFLEKTLKLCEQNAMPVVLQICTSFLMDDDFFATLLKQKAFFQIEWVLDSKSDLITQRILESNSYFKSTHITIPIFKSMDWNLVYCPKLFQHFKDVHLYFSYQLSYKSEFLNCKQAHYLVSLLRKQFPQFNFLPPKGVDIWDERAFQGFDMEPFVLPCFEAQSTNPNIRFSVIIPTYNNQNHLRAVLRHLYKQSVGLNHFEVIVVDDGGTDQTQALALKLLKEFTKTMNFKYIYFPRVQKRTMGDSQYRAGISRNLGAKNAVGDIFCFLDSDIVVPENYLEQVEKALSKWDGVQARRLNLSQSSSRLDIEYDQVKKGKDLIADEPYWEKFIQQKDWHKMPYNWKYVCTHSFSLKKSLFWDLGGLKKNFIFYGFEDADLGYRLVKRGFKLHLLDVEVFHMFHENARSEFLNLNFLRHRLLSKTAQIFYLHHLDEDIYENLIGFMEPGFSFRRFIKGALKTLSLQFLWGAQPSVYKSLRQLKPVPKSP